MDIIQFQDRVASLNTDKLFALYRECTPKVLVVTDTLNFSSAQAFGLSQFVNSLKAGKIHNMTPIVTTASLVNDPAADLKNYAFDDATTGLVKSRYDVVFLFGARSEGVSTLPAPQVTVINKFMQDGGGVFATGDHDTLGASLCGDILRVRGMRRWKAASTPPNAGSTTRFSTNLSGSDETEEFADQSDLNPQRLYLNFRTTTGGVGNPHPLMQAKAPRRAIEVFPDHPHEGECLFPSVAALPITEWPKDSIGGTVSPEAVAMSVSHGDGFAGKQALVPKLFAAVSAYDGHRANVGRVSTDSTWHHFININLDGTGAGGGLTGLQAPAGTDTDALTRIRQYYVNIATWLMPKTVRRCLRFPVLVNELSRFPLFEELVLRPIEQANGAELQQIGALLVRSLAVHVPAWEAQTLLADALEDALGEAEALRVSSQDLATGNFDAQPLALAALGGIVTSVATELAQMKSVEEITPHKSFEGGAVSAARTGAKLLLSQQREGLKVIDELLSRLEKPLVAR
ncbi:MAG: hypothetical protein RLZZ618_1235 [Pseudomonadota bacterium]